MTSLRPTLARLDPVNSHSVDAKLSGQHFLRSAFLWGGPNRRYVFGGEFGGAIGLAPSSVANNETALLNHVLNVALLGAEPEVIRVDARGIVA